jgi:hypothetical protein
MRRLPIAPVTVARISVATSGTDFIAPEGNAPAARLFERIQVGRIDDPSQPLIAYDQYGVTVDKAGMPTGVEVMEPL